MKKLMIAAFKQSQIPNLSELDIKGGIACESGPAWETYMQIHHQQQYVSVCNSMTHIQCTVQVGGQTQFSTYHLASCGNYT